MPHTIKHAIKHTIITDMRAILYYLREGAKEADNFLICPLSALIADGLVEVLPSRCGSKQLARLTSAGKKVEVGHAWWVQ